MNTIQKVLDAINRIPGAPVPKGELVIDRQFMEDYFAWCGNGEMARKMNEEEMLVEIAQRLQLNLVCIQSEAPLGLSSEGTNNVSKIDVMRQVGLFVFWIINGSFQTLMNQQGFLPLMKRAALEPDAIYSEMSQISIQIHKLIRLGINNGAHGVIIADDIAYQQNTYMAPSFYDTYLLPLWKDQVRAAKDLGVPIFFHSDGCINNILPMIVRAGFDGLQCIEAAAGMDIHEIKQNYGNKLCLMGNIDPALLVNDPTDDALRNAVTYLQSKIAPGGGFIFGTCSGLYAGMSPQKVHQMYHMF